MIHPEQECGEPEEELVRRLLGDPGAPPAGLEFQELIFPMREDVPRVR